MLDVVYKNESFIDLACLTCGKRWHTPKRNPLAQYVMGNNA